MKIFHEFYFHSLIYLFTIFHDKKNLGHKNDAWELKLIFFFSKMNKQTQCCNCLIHLKNECNIDLKKDKEYIGQNIIKINKDKKTN